MERREHDKDWKRRETFVMAVWLSVFHRLRVGEMATGTWVKLDEDGMQVITFGTPLKWKDVHLKRKLIHVQGPDSRVLTIPDKLLDVWKRWRYMNPTAVYVIPSPVNPARPMTRSRMEKRTKNPLMDTDYLVQMPRPEG